MCWVFFCHFEERDPRAMLEQAKQIAFVALVMRFDLRRNDKLAYSTLLL